MAGTNDWLIFLDLWDPYLCKWMGRMDPGEEIHWHTAQEWCPRLWRGSHFCEGFGHLCFSLLWNYRFGRCHIRCDLQCIFAARLCTMWTGRRTWGFFQWRAAVHVDSSCWTTANFLSSVWCRYSLCVLEIESVLADDVQGNVGWFFLQGDDGHVPLKRGMEAMRMTSNLSFISTVLEGSLWHL